MYRISSKLKTINIALPTALMLALLLSSPALADSCYVIENRMSHIAKLSFSYPGGVLPLNGLVSMDLNPGANFKYCLPGGISNNYYVYIDVLNGKWKKINRLAMGHGPLALPAGTYEIVNP